MSTPTDKWFYIYHRYGGKIVVHRAESTAHIRQALASDPNFSSAWVAGTHEPLDAATVEAMPKAMGLKFDATAQPPLAPFVPPVASARVTRASQRRAMNSAGVAPEVKK